MDSPGRTLASLPTNGVQDLVEIAAEVDQANCDVHLRKQDRKRAPAVGCATCLRDLRRLVQRYSSLARCQAHSYFGGRRAYEQSASFKRAICKRAGCSDSWLIFKDYRRTILRSGDGILGESLQYERFGPSLVFPRLTSKKVVS